MWASRENATVESFTTHIPNNVLEQVPADCGGCGKKVVLVSATALRKIGDRTFQTSIPGYACKEKGNTEDLMCGGINYPLGTDGAISRSLSRLMRDRGEHDIARSLRNARQRVKPQVAAPVELLRAS